MERVKIYLSGGMGNLTYEEMYEWRRRIIDNIRFGQYDCAKSASFFNPVSYYGFEEIRYRSEREVMEFDLNALRNSDLVIVNFNDDRSIGTISELAIAYEHRIPVIGINEDGKPLHPWLKEFVTRMCDSIQEAIEHAIDFYLN